MEDEKVVIAVNTLRNEMKHELGEIRELLVRIAKVLDGS